MAKNIFNILTIIFICSFARGAELPFCSHFLPNEEKTVALDIPNGIQGLTIDVADTTPKAAAKEPKKRSKKSGKKGSTTTTDSAASGTPQQTPQQTPPPAPPQGERPQPMGPVEGAAAGAPQQGTLPPPPGQEPRPIRPGDGVDGMLPPQGLPPQVVGDRPAVPADSSQTANPKEEKKKKRKSNNKKVTFETFDVNYQKAMKYYNNSQFLSAARIFEELYPLSMGTPQADTILFLFAECYYKNKDYEMAAFHFKDYAKRYPGTEKAQYAHYLCVKSVFLISPVYSVDQSSTLYAIDEMDLFIKNYPHSPYVEECNQMLDLLHEKLAQKDFEILKLYYNTDHFQAVQVATKNFLKDHPSSKYASEAVFTLIKSNFEYAKKSVEAKKRERYQACVDAFDIMQANFTSSPFYADAQKVAKEAKEQIKKLK